MLEVHRHRFLARVLRQERHAHAPGVQVGVSAQLPREVAAPRGLDLDDLRPHMRQLMAAERSRQHVRQVQNAGVFERFGHGGSSSRRTRRRPPRRAASDAFAVTNLVHRRASVNRVLPRPGRGPSDHACMTAVRPGIRYARAPDARAADGRRQAAENGPGGAQLNAPDCSERKRSVPLQHALRTRPAAPAPR
jgi:hypothetical protein